jgi:hypothetical protein
VHVIELTSVSKLAPSTSPFESLEAVPTATATEGSWGTATDEVSNSLRHLVLKGGKIARRVLRRSSPMTP